MDTGIVWALLSSLFLAGNSIIASKWLTEHKEIGAFQVTFLSLLPSFVICLVLIRSELDSQDSFLLSILFVKNALYGMAFFLRFLAFARCGMIAGSILASAQPIFVGFLADLFLGEHLTLGTFLAMLFVGLGIYFMTLGKSKQKLYLSDIIRYLLIPAVLISVVTVADRAVLKGTITGVQFFITDKLVLLPAFVIAVFVSNVFPSKTKINMSLSPCLKASWTTIFVLIVAGIFWLSSSFTYGMALDQASASVVSIIRSLSYPSVAISGFVIFKEPLTKTCAAGFVLITLSVIIINM